MGCGHERGTWGENSYIMRSLGYFISVAICNRTKPWSHLTILMSLLGLCGQWLILVKATVFRLLTKGCINIHIYLTSPQEVGLPGSPLWHSGT